MREQAKEVLRNFSKQGQAERGIETERERCHGELTRGARWNKRREERKLESF